jgi:hypothetical protein
LIGLTGYSVTIANRAVTFPAVLKDPLLLYLKVALTGSNWTTKLGIAAKLHAQWTNSAANSPCLSCVDGKVQASNARVVPSSASNFIQYLFPSSSLNLS